MSSKALGTALMLSLVLGSVSLAAQITGSGTTNRVTKFTASTSVGDSAISDTGGIVEINNGQSNYQSDLRLTTNNTALYASSKIEFNQPNLPPNGRLFEMMTANMTSGGGRFQFILRRRNDAYSAWVDPFTYDSASNDVIINNQVISPFTTGNFIVANGNAGIGTTTPTQKLDVSGNINIRGSGNGIIFPDGTKQTSALIGSGTITGVTAGSGLTGGGTAGNVALAVDSTVARTNTNQTFTGNLTVNGTITGTHVNSPDFVFAIHGSCITTSLSTPFVLNGLGQSNSTQCNYGPGYPTMNPVLGSVIPYSGILSSLSVVQTSLGGGNFGGTVQVYKEPFDQAGGWVLTPLNCTLTQSANNPLNLTTTCADGSNTVQVTAGEKILVLVTPPQNGYSNYSPVAAVLKITF